MTSFASGPQGAFAPSVPREVGPTPRAEPRAELRAEDVGAARRGGEPRLLRAEEIKRCPCCGGRGVLITIAGESCISCERCGIKTNFYTRSSQCYKVWNRRFKEDII